MKILITGYSGFIGKYLLQSLKSTSHEIALLGRKPPTMDGAVFHFAELKSAQDFSQSLNGQDIVIHIAAHTHIVNDKVDDPLTVLRDINTLATLALAQQAVSAGVKRFIFISSIKVNGESTEIDKPFTAATPHGPEDFYGQSKSEAELQLLELAEHKQIEIVIIRPTLVYGPGVKANFASLLKIVSKGLPLPFKSITENKRSLVSVRNLVDLIITCVKHPKAANQIFLVSDDEDLSTESLIRTISNALGKPNRQLPIPLWFYRLAGKIFHKEHIINRLTGSLQVDITHTKKTLDWSPPQTVKQGFKETAEYFLMNNKEKNKCFEQ